MIIRMRVRMSVRMIVRMTVRMTVRMSVRMSVRFSLLLGILLSGFFIFVLKQKQGDNFINKCLLNFKFKTIMGGGCVAQR